MTLRYTNYKGETFYLHKGTGKKGGSQYSFSKKEAGTPVKSIPKGYEAYEDPNGRVFLRKIVPKKITEEEVSVVENSIRQYAKLKDYKIDVKGKAITIYLPDQEIDDLRSCFDSLVLVEPHGHSPWHPSSRPSRATSRPNAGAFIHGQSPWPSAAGVNHSLLDKSLKNILTYSPIMRFILTDEKQRNFQVERAGFLDDDWVLLNDSKDLQKLAKKYCRHLGKESFYDLI